MMNSAADPLAVFRNTPQAMRRASIKLTERADACDDPLVAAELQRLASRCANRARELQRPDGAALSVLDLMIRPRR
jgi:hypothetical protein